MPKFHNATVTHKTVNTACKCFWNQEIWFFLLFVFLALKLHIVFFNGSVVTWSHELWKPYWTEWEKGTLAELSVLRLTDRAESPTSFEGKQMICHSVVVADGVGMTTVTLLYYSLIWGKQMMPTARLAWWSKNSHDVTVCARWWDWAVVLCQFLF